MKEITSKDNPKIKELKKLGSKKYRKKFGKFLVENLAIIYDAIKDGYKPELLFVTQEVLDSDSEKIKFILENIGKSKVLVISKDMNEYFSSLETSAGITAVYYKRREKVIDFEKKILYLNEIKDPGNLGTILRSAVAFGVSEIILDDGCVDLYNPKVIQSSKDAIFKVNVLFDKDTRLLRNIKDKMKVFVTDVDGGVEVKKAFIDEKVFCVIMGNESHGASKGVKKIASEVINIKSSSEMESLNVAVSTGIILYEMYNN